jgi:putative drug exporter of the RND superfamily
MISLVSRLAIGRPRLVVLGWLVLIAGLHYLAPPWERIVQDEPQLVPTDSPSVIGRQLLERGFPEDASGSDLVLIYERKNGRLTPSDFRFVDQETARLSRFARNHPEFGISKIDTYRSPAIGPRLIGSNPDGPSQAVLSIVLLSTTHLSLRTDVAVDRLLKWVNTEAIAPPRGLSRLVTGSAVVGHDNNAATRASVESTTNATIALVILLLVCIGAAARRDHRNRACRLHVGDQRPETCHSRRSAPHVRPGDAWSLRPQSAFVSSPPCSWATWPRWG